MSIYDFTISGRTVALGFGDCLLCFGLILPLLPAFRMSNGLTQLHGAWCLFGACFRNENLKKKKKRNENLKAILSVFLSCCFAGWSESPLKVSSYLS